MASEPTVCCIMLTRDRPAMAARAVASFRSQTYERKRLLVLDTGSSIPPDAVPWVDSDDGISRVVSYRNLQGRTIGELRNYANECAVQYTRTDILAHFDDDDWSHPNSLAERVALLQSSDADLVGYNQALFWDTRPYVAARERHERDVRIGGQAGGSVRGNVNEAWLYTAPGPGPERLVLGASMLYWRRVWERKPFTHTNNGEDRAFASGLQVVAVSGLSVPPTFQGIPRTGTEPRLICGVHGGNTATRIDGETANWHRVPEWDEYCARTMEL
jgi:glycosyltransferase involved in cell wall biosynthesis